MAIVHGLMAALLYPSDRHLGMHRGLSALSALAHLVVCSSSRCRLRRACAGVGDAAGRSVRDAAAGRRLAIFYLLTGVLYAMLALGYVTPLFSRTRGSPGPATLKYPHRLLFVSGLCLALLTAFGIDALAGRGARPAARWPSLLAASDPEVISRSGRRTRRWRRDGTARSHRGSRALFTTSTVRLGMPAARRSRRKLGKANSGPNGNPKTAESPTDG